MGIESLQSEVERFSKVYPKLSFEDFVWGGLQRAAIDPLNASRIVAASLDARLRPTARQAIAELVAEDTGERQNGTVLAPLLRVTGDFAAEDQVMSQSRSRAPWEQAAVWAVDGVEEEVWIQIEPGRRDVFHPRSPRIFPLSDYVRLEKVPGGKRRPPGSLLQYRFALGLSAYDSVAADEQIVRNVNRHFAFGQLTPVTFRPFENDR